MVIAGAGPAGLTAAAALARHGVRSTLVERRRRLSALPRATAVSTRSMELLRALGLEDEVRAGEVDARWQGLAYRDAGVGRPGEPSRSGFPSREAERAGEPDRPGVRAPGPPGAGPAAPPARHGPGAGRDGHRARARGRRRRRGPRGRPAGRRRPGSRVRARYLIAADGAHSAVRRRSGIPMDGPDDLGRVVAALVRAPLWEVAGPHRYGFYEITRPRRGGRHVPGRPRRPLAATATFGELGARRACGRPARGPEPRACRAAAGRAAGSRPAIERIGDFAFAAQVAARFRDGDVFLAGDAAHRMTPRGGTGMNTAIHDGWDLGWKLAWVLRGWAGPALLDSYEAERRPVAEQNVAPAPADPDRDVEDGPGHRPRRPPPPPLGADPGRQGLYARPARPGPHALTGPGRRRGGPRRRPCQGPLPLDVRGLERRRPGAGHPGRRRPARAARRRDGRLVAPRRGSGGRAAGGRPGGRGRRLRRAAGSRPRSR